MAAANGIPLIDLTHLLSDNEFMDDRHPTFAGAKEVHQALLKWAFDQLIRPANCLRSDAMKLMPLDLFGPGRGLHHVGLVVPDISAASPGIEKIYDPIQRVSAAFVDRMERL